MRLQLVLREQALGQMAGANGHRLGSEDLIPRLARCLGRFCQPVPLFRARAQH